VAGGVRSARQVAALQATEKAMSERAEETRAALASSEELLREQKALMDSMQQAYKQDLQVGPSFQLVQQVG
jgi:predicted  nucleic acid-binding Zn-ribbon protein